MSDLSRAFGNRSEQQTLYAEGVRIFEESRRSVPPDALYRLDMLWAEREAAKHQGRGNSTRERAFERYERELCDQLRRYSMPPCFGENGAYRGLYAPLTAAEVLLGEKPEISAIDALRALSEARIDAPETKRVSGSSGLPATFDPTDPSTWRTSATIAVMLCPSGDVGAWAWRMQQAYRLQLANSRA